MKVILTEEQLNNLRVFLQRVDLKGNEVPAYVEIMNSLHSATIEEGEEDGIQ